MMTVAQQEWIAQARAVLDSPEANRHAENGEMENVIDMLTGAMMRMAARIGIGNIAAHRYEFQCRRDGALAWEDFGYNLTTNVGLDDILTNYWKGSTYTASHFIGLTDGTPTFAAGDTMASHAGWAEAVPYSESTRQALTLGSVSSQSVDNSASPAAFSINTGDTVGGGFITTNNTKSGTTGVLVGGSAFTGGDRTVANNDTVNVTATLTQASA